MQPGPSAARLPAQAATSTISRNGSRSARRSRRSRHRDAPTSEPTDTVLWKAAERRAVAAKLRAGLHSRAFTSWEAKFAADVAQMIETDKRRRFSPRQVATAEELAAKAARWNGRS